MNGQPGFSILVGVDIQSDGIAGSQTKFRAVKGELEKEEGVVMGDFQLGEVFLIAVSLPI